MIRKKRTTTQVELFEGQAATPETPAKKGHQQIAKVTFARDFQLPIQLDYVQSDDTPSTGEIVRMLNVPRAEPFVAEDPQQVTEPDSNLSTDGGSPEQRIPVKDTLPTPPKTSETDRLIINRDFADGFSLTQAQLKAELENLETREKQLSETMRRQRVIKLAAVALLSFAVLLLWNWQEWVVNSSLFTLKNVYVHGNLISNKEDILRDANPDLGIRLAEVDLAKIAERVSKNPLFKTVAVSRSYPSSITIHVTERQPFAFVLLDNLHAVDESGFVLPKLSVKMIYNLPVVSGVPTIATPGKPIQAGQMTTALHFLQTIRQIDETLYYEISEVHFNKESILAYLNGMRTSFVLNNDHFERTAVYMASVIKHLKQNELTHAYKNIDLRYEGQIIAK